MLKSRQKPSKPKNLSKSTSKSVTITNKSLHTSQSQRAIARHERKRPVSTLLNQPAPISALSSSSRSNDFAPPSSISPHSSTKLSTPFKRSQTSQTSLLPSLHTQRPRASPFSTPHRRFADQRGPPGHGGFGEQDEEDTAKVPRKKPEKRPPTRRELYEHAERAGLYDSRDREIFPQKSLDSLDDVLQRRYGPGMGPYAPFHEGVKADMRGAKDIVYDHTLPKGAKPAQWSFPPDAPVPPGYQKYEAPDGTWWRKQDEKSDHEDYQMPKHDYQLPDYLKRYDRRKKYYTYMHRDPIDHINPGNPTPSYRSQTYWFYANKYLDKIDAVFRLFVHTFRPVWILTKIMFRIPEFTIKFILHIKVEIFRYIEKRWGPPDKRDPYVYKFIPGMLDAVYNGTRIISDYIERWGVRDPDVGAALRKYHVLDFNIFIMTTAMSKLESLRDKHYQEYLDDKKKKAKKEFEKSQAYRYQQADIRLKEIIGTHDYTLLTGLVPGDKFYGKGVPEMMSELKSRPPITPSDVDELIQIKELFRKNRCVKLPAFAFVAKKFDLNAPADAFQALLSLVVDQVKALYANDKKVELQRQSMENTIRHAETMTSILPILARFKLFKDIEEMKDAGFPTLDDTLHKHFDLIEMVVKDDPEKMKSLNDFRTKTCAPKAVKPPPKRPVDPMIPGDEDEVLMQDGSTPPSPPPTTSAFALPSSSPAFAMPLSSTSFAIPPPNSTAFAMPPLDATAFAMPVSTSTTFAMPGTSDSTTFPMPATSNTTSPNSTAGFAIVVDPPTSSTPPPPPQQPKPTPKPTPPRSSGNDSSPGIIML